MTAVAVELVPFFGRIAHSETPHFPPPDRRNQGSVFPRNSRSAQGLRIFGVKFRLLRGFSEKIQPSRANDSFALEGDKKMELKGKA